jgi:hypothetical protein
MTVYLERITVRFPRDDTEFTNDLLSLLDVLGRHENHILGLTRSSQGFYPEIQLEFQSGYSDILTDFTLSNGGIVSVKVENSTGLSKQSPHSFKSLSVEAVNQRLVTSGISLIGIDHIGFNLPWFDPGLHPRILQLRERLSSRCLYHSFPTGEPWDFIIPGDKDEIANYKAVDYTEVRRPKFELVSFGKASTPLIQFDVSVNVGYERFSQLFPESLNDPEFSNLWIYLENPYTIDVCLVINEFSESDWSAFFNGFRL